ncbi:uncharacterized protein DS421_5g156010 [Arachis hypogaea]|nr:uncharacterized protein DS421_5g156010 [Arachis hypogaea]
MDTPEHVWQKIWTLLCDDILHRQRTLLDNSGSMKFILLQLCILYSLWDSFFNT